MAFYPWALAWVGRTDEAIAQAERNKENTQNLATKLALMPKYSLQSDASGAKAEFVVLDLSIN